jgi:replicative DNA helicase
MNDLEFAVLTAVSKHQKVALDFAYTCDESLFESPDAIKFAKVFIEYIKIYKSKPSRRTVNSFYDDSEDSEYNVDDYQYDVSRLKQRHGERRLEAVKGRLNQGGLDDVTGTTKAIELELGAIKAANGHKAYERNVIRNYIDEFRNAYVQKHKNPNLGKGILTHYSFLDYIKNGLRPSDLVIIAGETGSGKSMYLNNIALQIWMQENNLETPPDKMTKGYNVTFFSLEMPYEDCFRRSMARLADVHEYGIRDAKLSREESKSVAKACKFIKEFPYEFDIVDVPRGFTVEQMEIMFEEIKSEYIPDVIFIDYMGLMEDMSDADDWLALGKLAGKIHEFARVHAIPVVTAVQLNRIDPNHKKTESKSIGLHRIGRSSMIAHHATIIIQIESRQDEETHDDFIYHIIKNRHGQSNKSHSVYKNFNKCSIMDKPYDVDAVESWTSSEDISEDISDLLGIT